MSNERMSIASADFHNTLKIPEKQYIIHEELPTRFIPLMKFYATSSRKIACIL